MKTHDYKKLYKAIDMLFEKYDDAVELDYVKNKIAWALYQVWKEFDKRCV